MTTCRFCGAEIEPDPDEEMLTDEQYEAVAATFNEGICDDCARKAVMPTDRPGELHWARARLAVWPELARR